MTEITTRDVMKVVAKQIAHALVNGDLPEQDAAKLRFKAHASAMSASEYQDFAITVSQYAESMRHGQEADNA